MNARPLTLVVISYPSVMVPLFEEAARHYARLVCADFAVERCQNGADLEFVTQLWKRRGRRLIRLDLHGHGDPGRFKLGDELLFASDGTGYSRLRRLRATLAREGVLRLLGCQVAGTRHPRDPRPFSGRRLLRDLQRLLGVRRRVVASAQYLFPAHWHERGLLPSVEASLMGA